MAERSDERRLPPERLGVEMADAAYEQTKAENRLLRAALCAIKDMDDTEVRTQARNLARTALSGSSNEAVS